MNTDVSNNTASSEVQWEMATYDTDNVTDFSGQGQGRKGRRRTEQYTLTRGSSSTTRAQSTDSGVHNHHVTTDKVHRLASTSAGRLNRQKMGHDQGHGRNTKTDGASNDSRDADAENLRRMYEAHLDNEESSSETSLVDSNSHSANQHRDGDKNHRSRHGDSQLKRSRRKRRLVTGSAHSAFAAVVFYPTIRYRYKREFHGYKYQHSNRSIIDPPLSLRTTVNYDKVPVLLRCDSTAKQQNTQLAITTDSGFHTHSHGSALKPYNSHTHGPSSLMFTGSGNHGNSAKNKKHGRKETATQRNVRIQCDLPLNSNGNNDGTKSRQHHTVTFEEKSVEKRSVSIQYDTPHPVDEPTVEVIHVEMTNMFTQTPAKKITNRGTDAMLPHKPVDNFVQCKPTMSTAAVQCIQAHVKNTATQSDHVPAPPRPIIDCKHVTIQCSIGAEVLTNRKTNALETQPTTSLVNKTFKDSTKDPLSSRPRSPITSNATGPGYPGTSMSSGLGYPGTTIISGPGFQGIPVMSRTGFPGNTRPGSSGIFTTTTPLIETPLAFDTAVNKSLSRPRCDLYIFLTEDKEESVKLQQQIENRSPDERARRQRNVEQTLLKPLHHEDSNIEYRGIRAKRPSRKYHGLYRLVTG